MTAEPYPLVSGKRDQGGLKVLVGGRTAPPSQGA